MINPYLQKDDGEIWKSLREGDLRALEALYRRHYALLLNYGTKCTADEELVRDCIQDVFVKLAKSTSLSDTASPRSYLLKSLRNRINDKSTSTGCQVACFSFNDDLIANKIADNSADGKFVSSDEDIRMQKALKQALSQLTPQQKHILYLRYIKGLSHKEVAEAMDMNVQSSMNLLSRSIAKLRAILSCYSIPITCFLQYMNFIDMMS